MRGGLLSGNARNEGKGGIQTGQEGHCKFAAISNRSIV